MDYLRSDLKAADEASLDTAARFFRHSLARNLTNTVEEKQRDYLSASSHWECARRIIYSLTGAEKSATNPRSRIAFLMGDMVEQMGLVMARLAGVDIVTPGLDGVQEGGEIRIAGEPIRYHIDATVRDSAGVIIPVDFKSMAKIGFQEFERAINNPAADWWTEHRWRYLAQLRIYMAAKNAPYGVFVAVSKETGHLAEMHVPFDVAWFGELEERIRYVAKHRDAGTLPPRPSWATTEIKMGENIRADGSKGAVEEVAHWSCGYCDRVGICYEGFSLTPLKAGPKWRKAISAEANVAATK